MDDQISSKLQDYFTSLSFKLDKFDGMPDQVEQLTIDQLKKRRLAVIDLFSKNHINLKSHTNNGDESDVLSIFDSVFIKPPYKVESCFGQNVIALNRVKRLISDLDQNS